MSSSPFSTFQPHDVHDVDNTPDTSAFFDMFADLGDPSELPPPQRIQNGSGVAFAVPAQDINTTTFDLLNDSVMIQQPQPQQQPASQPVLQQQLPQYPGLSEHDDEPTNVSSLDQSDDFDSTLHNSSSLPLPLLPPKRQPHIASLDQPQQQQQSVVTIIEENDDDNDATHNTHVDDQLRTKPFTPQKQHVSTNDLKTRSAHGTIAQTATDLSGQSPRQTRVAPTATAAAAASKRTPIGSKISTPLPKSAAPPAVPKPASNTTASMTASPAKTQRTPLRANTNNNTSLSSNRSITTPQRSIPTAHNNATTPQRSTPGASPLRGTAATPQRAVGSTLAASTPSRSALRNDTSQQGLKSHSAAVKTTVGQPTTSTPTRSMPTRNGVAGGMSRSATVSASVSRPTPSARTAPLHTPSRIHHRTEQPPASHNRSAAAVDRHHHGKTTLASSTRIGYRGASSATSSREAPPKQPSNAEIMAKLNTIYEQNAMILDNQNIITRHFNLMSVQDAKQKAIDEEKARQEQLAREEAAAAAALLAAEAQAAAEAAAQAAAVAAAEAAQSTSPLEEMTPETDNDMTPTLVQEPVESINQDE